MTTYDRNATYAYLETPLNDPEESYWFEDDRERAPQLHHRMLLVLIAAGIVLFGFGAMAVRQSDIGRGGPRAQAAIVEQAAPAVEPAAGGIAPLFTREVQHWAPQIVAWSAAAGVDPNMAATIMQIESCGDPQAVSVAGASGLFQVMPFHFTDEEDRFYPDTNAYRGLNYFADRLEQTQGDVGRAFAGYNGGHVAAAGSWDSWAAETQRYYTWSTGIYADAQAGSATSETLDRWLAAGGAGLCRQAAQRLGLTP